MLIRDGIKPSVMPEKILDLPGGDIHKIVMILVGEKKTAVFQTVEIEMRPSARVGLERTVFFGRAAPEAEAVKAERIPVKSNP